MVTGNLEAYKNAWLYALALHWDVEIAALDLDELASAAAFRLSEAFGEMDEDWSPEHLNEEDEEEDVRLLWDERPVDLPKELAFIWKGVLAGDRKLEMRTLLDHIPRFSGLPVKPAEINYRQDGSSKRDREAKAWQATCMRCECKRSCTSSLQLQGTSKKFKCLGSSCSNFWQNSFTKLKWLGKKQVYRDQPQSQAKCYLEKKN
jgi:hypothetical protein